MRALRVLSAALAFATLGASPPQTQLYGYTFVGSNHERDVETSFLALPSASGALNTATAIAGQPHFAGSPADYQAALALRDQLHAMGFTASLEPLTARVDSPKNVALTLYPTGRTAPIATKSSQSHGIFSRPKPRPSPTPSAAPGLAAIPTPEAVPPVKIDLHEPAIPGDADTDNPAIGLPFLAGSADGDVAAPLVYAGFGSDADYALLTAHGIEVRGAVVIVRNGRDPRGVVARRAQARGVAGAIFYDDPAEDGPGRGAAYPNGPYRPLSSVRRGSVGEGVTIPVLPVSAANAQILIGALHGPSAAPPWSGGLAVRYPFARGPATVRLSVQLTRKQSTLWNTIGVLSGTHPVQSVILGARRDTWSFGARDNASGIGTLIEVARGLGFLASGGWQPQRTIVIAAWDGEDIGGAGTIAYVKRHGEELQAGGVAYLDADDAVTGPQFGADAVAAIGPTVADATHMVDDPAQPGATLYDRWARFARTIPGRPADPARGAAGSPLFGIGIPTTNTGFSGVIGPTASAYNTVAYATTYADPGFALHRTVAQLYGVIAMRIADADVVPYYFSAYVPALQSAARALAAAAARGKTHLDTSGLGASIARYAAAARKFDAATARVATAAAGDRAIEAVQVLDVATYGADGYGVVTFPEIAHAVTAGDQSDIDRAVARTRAALDRTTELLAL